MAAQPEAAGAIVVTERDRGRREALGPEALISVHGVADEEGELARALELAGDEGAEGRAHVARRIAVP